MENPDPNRRSLGGQKGADLDAEQEEVYAEGTPLTWVFGDHPEVRLVAAILSEGDGPLNKTDLARLAGVIRNNVYDHLDPLRNHGIIESTRSVGNITLFELADTETTRLLFELEAAILKRDYQSDQSDIDSVNPQNKAQKEIKIEDPYAEGTPLTWIFGDHPEPKLIAAFLSEPDQDLNISDWARIAGLSRGAVYNHYDTFLEFGMINYSYETANSQHYRLNLESPIVQLLFDLEEQLLRNWHKSQRSDGESSNPM